MHSLGSEQLGRGPYPDNTFSLTVDDGEIVDASMELASRTNGFSEEMWRPFARWVSGPTPPTPRSCTTTTRPRTGRIETPRSFALWRQHVKDYVEAKAPPGS